MEIRDDSTLKEILAQLDREKIDRPLDAVKVVARDHDFTFKESLKSRLEAKPRGRSSTGKIWAKIPLFKTVTYELETEREIASLLLEQGFGGSLANHKQRIYRLSGGGKRLGGIHYFPNTELIFTTKEACTELSLIEFREERFVFYKAETKESLLKSSRYAVVTTETGDLVAVILEGGGWFSMKRYLKLHRPCSDLFIALLMATFHGLVFKRETGD